MKTSFTKKIFGLPRPAKRMIQFACDVALIVLCFWTAMALRLDGIFTEIMTKSWMTLAAVIPTTILIFARLGLYRAVVRFMAESAVTSIIIGAATSSIIMFVTSQYFELGVPRSVSGIYFSLLVLTMGGTRLIMRNLYLTSKEADRAPVVIYSAGEAGRLLMRSIQESKNYRPYLFIDEDKSLHGTTISNIPILPLKNAKEKISDAGVKTALIAIEENDEKGRRKAALEMADLGVEIRMIPKISDLISGSVKISSLRRVKIEELIGRDTVAPYPSLMSETTKGQCVMVTGAGGSIGSELCRQVLHQSPRRLILVDVSEYGLHTITEELTTALRVRQDNIDLVSVLGSVTQQQFIESVITENSVNTVFHAAAYKHVPMVEKNALEAIRNNSLGTQLTAQAAGRLGVQHFVLISSDKAVRPTNIMGATKRLAELVVSQTAKTYTDTKFCSVRFGNVLGSSGSVVPKFEKQIREGGPITLTHPEMRRYFMTTPEAAQLVIQASAMASQGNVFVLDMGEPIRILDLARTMCALNARNLHTDETKEASEDAITLQVTGLRPGEKLYEELLMTGQAETTRHPKIKCEQNSDVQNFDAISTINHLLQLRNRADIIEALTRLPLQYSIEATIRETCNKP